MGRGSPRRWRRQQQTAPVPGGRSVQTRVRREPRPGASTCPGSWGHQSPDEALSRVSRAARDKSTCTGRSFICHRNVGAQGTGAGRATPHSPLAPGLSSLPQPAPHPQRPLPPASWVFFQLCPGLSSPGLALVALLTLSMRRGQETAQGAQAPRSAIRAARRCWPAPGPISGRQDWPRSWTAPEQAQELLWAALRRKRR